MPTATNLPCSLIRLASPRRHAWQTVVACLLAWTLHANVPLSASEAESVPSLVGTPSREEPRKVDGASALVILQPKTKLQAKTVTYASMMTMPPRKWSWDPVQRLATKRQDRSDTQRTAQPHSEPPVPDASASSVEVIAPSEPTADEPSPTKASDLAVDISLPSGNLPSNKAAARAASMPVQGDSRLAGRWAMTDLRWSATCMRHRPLYFEEVNLERYGYTPSYTFQPLISAARFFATIPALPYKMVVERPRRCTYTLGHYRPGNCAPRR